MAINFRMNVVKKKKKNLFIEQLQLLEKKVLAYIFHQILYIIYFQINFKVILSNVCLSKYLLFTKQFTGVQLHWKTKQHCIKCILVLFWNIQLDLLSLLGPDNIVDTLTDLTNATSILTLFIRASAYSYWPIIHLPWLIIVHRLFDNYT